MRVSDHWYFSFPIPPLDVLARRTRNYGSDPSEKQWDVYRSQFTRTEYVILLIVYGGGK